MLSREDEMMKDDMTMKDSLREVSVTNPVEIANELEEEDLSTIEIPDEIKYDIQMGSKKAKDDAATFVSNFKPIIDSYNYVELGILNMNLKRELEQLDSTKAMMNSINDLKDVEDLTKNIMSENALDFNEIRQEKESFLNDYDAYKEGYEELIEYIAENYKKYEGQDKSTKFLTDQLIESVEKRKKKLEDSDASDASDNDREIQRLEKTIEIYSNRTDLSYIERKLQNTATLKRIKKEYLDNSRKSIRKGVKNLMGTFSQEQIIAFEEIMIGLFGDRLLGDIFVIHMAHLYKTEARHNDHTRIRVMIMNLIDIQNGIFDIGDPEEYLTSIKNLRGYYITDSNKTTSHTNTKNIDTLEDQIKDNKLSRGATSLYNYYPDESANIDEFEN